MRHGKKFNHLSRKKGHRKAMLANMATSLILHKRIKTTVAKAKALRSFIEPVITRAKEDTTHNRRMAFRYLASKEGVKVLFDEVANRIADRPGGYTRIIRMGNRLGDNAEMAMIELVDYNTLYTQAEEKKKSRKRRTRRGSAGSGSTGEQQEQKAQAATAADEAAEAKEEEVTDVAEEAATATTPEADAPSTEATADEPAAEETQEAPSAEKADEEPSKEEDDTAADEEDEKKS